ncbi:MAG: 50S ribosomal protein L18 [Candidatus Aenigmarchaeota archaeon]|nr:50S ribosomal protein L18 [Candidatus Aenigmarchaeota archaeon]
MARGPKYIVPHRRRREGKTDYRKRLKLLKSGKPRLVVRKSLRHIRAQIIEYNPSGDRTLVSASSEELKKFGWNLPTGNTPAAYLVGLLIGKRALEKNIKEAVLDVGLQNPVKGGRIFALLKGALDAGLNVPHGEGIFPSENRIRGEHISSYLEKYKNMPEIFEKVKKKILGG